VAQELSACDRNQSLILRNERSLAKSALVVAASSSLAIRQMHCIVASPRLRFASLLRIRLTSGFLWKVFCWAKHLPRTWPGPSSVCSCEVTRTTKSS
jgi:hypothetical protein